MLGGFPSSTVISHASTHLWANPAQPLGQQQAPLQGPHCKLPPGATRPVHRRAPGHADGSWGYTILRTTYTPESDALFPVALGRLTSYIQWWCRYLRFCEESGVGFADTNEEVCRRLYFDVVDDRDGLAHLDSNGDSSAEDRFAALGAYFNSWAAGVDTGEDPENNPRYCVCLVLDSESMASLVRLPEELPPLRCAATIEETTTWLDTGNGGWVWLLEVDYMAEPEEHDDSYHGWLRVAVCDLETSWFRRLTRGNAPCFLHKERPQGSGTYHYLAH